MVNNIYKYNYVKNSFIQIREIDDENILKAYFIHVKHYNSEVFDLYCQDTSKNNYQIDIYLDDYKTITTKILINKVLYNDVILYIGENNTNKINEYIKNIVYNKYKNRHTFHLIILLNELKNIEIITHS